MFALSFQAFDPSGPAVIFWIIFFDDAQRSLVMQYSSVNSTGATASLAVPSCFVGHKEVIMSDSGVCFVPPPDRPIPGAKPNAASTAPERGLHLWPASCEEWDFDSLSPPKRLLPLKAEPSPRHFPADAWRNRQEPSPAPALPATLPSSFC